MGSVGNYVFILIRWLSSFSITNLDMVVESGLPIAVPNMCLYISIFFVKYVDSKIMYVVLGILVVWYCCILFEYVSLVLIAVPISIIFLHISKKWQQTNKCIPLDNQKVTYKQDLQQHNPKAGPCQHALKNQQFWF